MNDLERYLTALWRPGEVREIRSPRYDGRSTAAGYFDDPAALATAVSEWDGKANLYVTLNPVQPSLLARAANRIDRRAKSTTADVDILERRWVYIDIDPVRPAGISATDVESAAALGTARDITAYLTERGWPIPMVAMSGNGYALIIPIHLPNDQASTALVAGVLGHLAARFSTETVNVDTTVSNAARIVALIGTMKVKGDSTTERPHRRATLVWVPEKFDPVPIAKLAELTPPPQPVSQAAGGGTMERGWVREALQRAQVTFKEQPADTAGIIWYGLKTCPYHPDDGAAWQCGVGEAPDGHATGKCFHSRGAGKTWHDFKRELGLDVGQGRVELRIGPPSFTNGTSPVGMDAADLLALDLPPLRWVVPGLVPEGTTILAAPPKVGKSCLVYQMAVEASMGGTLLDQRVESGSVLYLALEDGRRRGQERLRAALAGRTMPRGRLEIRWSAPRIGDGLEEALSAWLDSHPDALLVALDTLGKVRPTGGDNRRNAYDIDVGDMARLQSLFRDRPVGLVIVHHLRKESDNDFLTAVSGTYGITGSADTIAVMRRKRLEAFGTINVTGRDVADSELSVRFDGMTWHAAPAALPAASFERTEVYRCIQDDGPVFPTAISKKTGLARTSVQNMVTKLVERGAVIRTVDGYAVVSVDLRIPDDSSDSSDSDDSKSHTSHQEDYRARAASVLAEERVIDSAMTPDDSDGSRAWVHPCLDYTAHRDHHRQTPAGWTCDTCHPEGALA